MQVKLAALAEDIGKLGLAVSIVCFLANVIIWLIRMSEPVSVTLLFVAFSSQSVQASMVIL